MVSRNTHSIKDITIPPLTLISKTCVETLSRWCRIFGGIALIATMLVTVIDVCSRAIGIKTIPGGIEIIEVMLIIVMFSGMAYTGFTKGHIRVSMLVDRFPTFGKLAVTAGADLIAIGIIIILCWQNFAQGQYLRSSGYQTGLLHIPRWPFAIVTAFFMIIFAFTILIDFIENLSDLISSGKKNCVWLIPAILIPLMLFTTSFWPSIFHIKLEAEIFGIISFLLLFILIFLNVHIGAAMATVAFWGMSYMISPSAGLSMLGMVSQTVASNYTWAVGPLFALMGLAIANSGASRDIYNAGYKWLGHTHGGLASATIAACGLFAAVVGESMAGVITIGPIAYPQMKAYRYHDKLATGAICAGATLGVLIPPSLGFIIYGIIVEQSIGKLFIAGIIPGIILASAMILFTNIRCRINPSLGPRGPKSTFIEKLVSLKDSSPFLFLFLLIIGGIYLGFFTPNEAGAIGSFAALIISIVMGRLTYKKFIETVTGAVGVTAMVFFILIYATALSQFLAVTKLPFALGDFVAQLNVHRFVALCLILLSYLILGCVMNMLPAIILTLPVIYPTILALGFDPIWFGVLLVMMIEIAQLTPPIGMNVFAMAGIARDASMYNIFWGVIPFWIVMMLVVILVMSFPQIALFLPNLMM